ncbi:MAG: TonB-dependent receptor [Candidatus Eiseniibacteriota bacterium]
MKPPRRRFSQPLLAAFAVILPLATGSVAAWAQGTGRVTGSVVDRKTGRALAFVNVAIPEARLGALSDSKGEFLIGNIPPGTYSVRAQFTGYAPESVAGIVVTTGQTTPLKITMQEIVVKEEEAIVVTGERPLVDVKSGGTVRSVRAEDIENQGLQTLNEVIQQQAGVSNENNLIRVRGGRADETTVLIDGIANRNPISGESTAGSVNARSVAEVSVISSGFSARYGQALSGIVDVRLKEGGSRFEGGLSAQVGNWFTQFYNGTISGPDWFKKGLDQIGIHLPGEASYLFDLSADFSNTYFPNIQDLPGRPRLRSGYEDSFLGFNFTYSPNFFMPAEENTWRGLYKWTWKPNASRKVELSFNKRIQFDQGFNRRPLRDLAGQALSYPWDWHERLDHYGTVTEDVNTFAIDLTQTFNPRTYHTLKLSRFFTSFQYAVNGKTWSEYVRPDPDPGYFVLTGDDNAWTHFWTQNLGIDYRLGAKLGRVHNTEFGFQHMFQDVQYVTIIDPWEYDPDGLGGDHDLWHVYPSMGALYATDRLEYEGFIAEGGLRADYYFPGTQLEDAVADPNNGNISNATRVAFYEDTGEIFGHRVKAVLSPRVTVSHPIQNRDKLFFNFGQFTQFPSYYYIYSKLTSVSSASFPVLGNANLNPEKSVQFEVGAEHVFTDGLAGKISLFQKDIYDYPTSVRFRRQEGTVISDFFVYLNSDFSRARGFEIEFEKVRRKYWRYKATYEYSLAKGKSSDPNQAKVVEEGGGDASEVPLSEGYLFWNRPHKLTFNVDFRVPSTGSRPTAFGLELPHDFGANLFAQFQSGRAYTPTDVAGNATGRVFSQNGPVELLMNLRLNQDFKLGQQRLGVSLMVENLLDWEIVRRLDSNTGEAPQEGQGMYVSPSQFDRDAVLTNPANYGTPRRWRLGVDYDF